METQSVAYRTRTPDFRGPVAGAIKFSGTSAFDPANVIYLESSGNYTFIHFNDGRKHLLAITLQEVAKRLPTLLRVHRSYAIAAAGVSNLRWVRQANGKRVLVVTMRNKTRIDIPRRKSAELAVELAQRTGILIKE